ncbi:MAG: sigma-54 dependent transcriptional regulator [Verrucomicrobiales bacterium]|nr:sigma-54 dependent transcriptional regulator [Verrucomicrobiales bacterium]
MTPPIDPIKATILVVDDIVANRNLLREHLETQGYEVLLAPDGETALKAATRALPDLVLMDVMMPGWNGFETCRRLKQNEGTRGIPVIFITAADETLSMVEGFQAGGVDYITKPFQAEEVLIRVKTHLENARLTKIVVEKNRELGAANERLRQEMAGRRKAEASLATADEQLSLISKIEAERWGVAGLVGRSPTLAKILDQVRKVQPLPSTSVLITGESGTGKELIARAIHFGSPRATKPFLPVNCSAIPADLAESLFFGYVKGAFSGAVSDKKGYFDSAQGGTLFLDEIGDMPLALQAKLLRALETGRMLPLGAAQEKALDVRIVAATNADLQAEIAAGKFREDLYFRLARFVAEVPPLRDRREDIHLLAEHFLKVLSAEMGLGNPGINREALTRLGSYDYPGNVRELKNLIERALIESGGGTIEPEHLRFLREPHLASTAQSDTWLNAELSPEGERCGNSSGEKQIARSSNSGEEEAILNYVRQHGTINNTQCRELLAVGIHRAWYLLRKLQRRGSLVQDNSRRWALYRLPSRNPQKPN